MEFETRKREVAGDLSFEFSILDTSNLESCFGFHDSIKLACISLD